MRAGSTAGVRGGVVVLIGVIALSSTLLTGPPASAAVSGASSTTTTEVAAGTQAPLSGLSVSVGDAEAVDVNVATTRGTLTVNTGTGVALAYGYASTGAEVAFGGTGAQVNAALASLTLTTSSSDKASTATISITARNADGYIYSSQTEHFYEYVASSGVTWSSARTAATGRSYRGQSGYLATVPNSRINDLITSKIPGALNVWLGGRGTLNTGGYGRVWTWVDGPLAGQPFSRCSSAGESVSCDFVDSSSFYYAWAPGEPNNYTGGEPYIVTNWTTANGRWNDLPNSAPGISGYVVEYGNQPVGSSGFSGVYKASSTVAIKGTPDAPGGVSASAGEGQATVTFSAPGNDGGAAIDGYRVTTNPGGSTTACTSPCTITGLTAGQNYSFTVEAHNAYGWSAASASASTTPGVRPGTPSGIPTLLLKDHAPSASASATGYPAPTYTVTAGTLPGGVTLNATTGALEGAPTSTGSFLFTVTASNTYGSASAGFAIDVESVPVIGTTALGSIRWNTPYDGLLAASAVPNATWSVTAGGLPDGLTLDADGRLHGTPTAVGAYSVSLTATNSHGSDTVALAGSVDPIPATAPSITLVTPSDSSLTLAFDAPASTGGASVSGYEYSIDGGSTWLPGAFGVTTSPLTVTGLANGTAYDIMLRAVTAAGGGAASAPAPGTPRTIASAVTLATVTPGDHSAAVAFTPPADNGGSAILGYRYSIDGGTTWSSSMVSTLTSPITIYGLENGRTYSIALRAVTAAGDGVASTSLSTVPISEPVSLPGDSTPPELPPGSAGASQNGQSVTTTSGARGTGWHVSTASTTLMLEAYDARARLVAKSGGEAYFEGYVNGYVGVSGEGFKPGSTVDIWVFSTPVKLGSLTVEGDGTFSGMLRLPTSIEAGTHTIQVNGVTASEETASTSVGLRVSAAVPRLASTGADVTWWPVAALLIGAGTTLLLVSRRRPASTQQPAGS